jgi:hypothetical protein
LKGAYCIVLATVVVTVARVLVAVRLAAVLVVVVAAAVVIVIEINLLTKLQRNSYVK